MKARYYILALAALVAGACQEEVDLREAEKNPIIIQAYQEGQDVPSRTAIQNGGTEVYWEAADEVKVFYNGVGSRFTSTNTEPVGVAQFTGYLTTVIGFNEGFSNDNPLWGLYPYRADATSDGASVTTTLPAAQTGRAGSFAKNTHITLGRSTSLSMGFYAVCGGVRFSVTQEGVQYVTFEGNNEEALAGRIKMAFADGVPEVQEITEPETVITLTAPGGGAFQTGQWYYISAIPGTLSGGFKMKFYKETEVAELSYSGAVTIKRGIFGSLANVDASLTYNPISVPKPEVVDMGLSVKWASFNLGASAPQEYGSYYAWGETLPKASYSWSNYSYGGFKQLVKYCPSDKTDYWGGAGSPDNKTVLDPEDDVAHVNLGGTWRMPTGQEWEELRDNSSVTQTSNYQGTGIAGWIVTSTKPGYTDRSLFFPAAGYWADNYYNDVGSGGYYWSSSLKTDNPNDAKCAYLLQGSLISVSYMRYSGRSVRPVCTGEPTPDDIIQFADPIAKYACVEMFDTGGDGELSYAEAAAATSLEGLFTNWNAVTCFDEIQYFTGVTSTEGVFTGLTKLTHITIPDWITTLGSFQNCTALDTVALPVALHYLTYYCFDGCSALKKVTLPTGIESIPYCCFRGCGALESLVIPTTVTSLGHYAFSGCTLLAGVELPSGLQTIGNYAFQNCQSITSLDFPATLTSIGQYAFNGCTALTSAMLGSNVTLGQYAYAGCSSLASVVLPENMTSIPNYCFWNCRALAAISWPEGLTTIGDYAFCGCRFEGANYTVSIPPTVTSIGEKSFEVRHLLIPSTSPVNIASDSFAYGYTFAYVPSNMVALYKMRTNWNVYVDHIKPIGDYPVELTLGGMVGEAVDLGLSVKWASWNIGASQPEEYGAYFAWGETEIKWEYNYLWTPYPSNYKWNLDGDFHTFTKYNTKSEYGIVDNKTALDIEDDAAHVNWGGTWRMPTKEELQELLDNCSIVWTTQNGVDGRLFTSNKVGYTSKSIFLPAAGIRENTGNDYYGHIGAYWSSSLDSKSPNYAYYLNSRSDKAYVTSLSRHPGKSIRPVCD